MRSPTFLRAVMLVATLVAMASCANAQIFVTDPVGGTVAEYSTSGALINPALITGLHGPSAIAVSGSHLFITNQLSGTVGEYTTSGATVNASLLTGITRPIGLTVSGTDLYVVSNFTTVGKYTTAGATVNPTLINAFTNTWGGIAVSGSHLFIAGEALEYEQYSTSGVLEARIQIGTGFGRSLAVLGSSLFVDTITPATIQEWSTTGTKINGNLINNDPSNTFFSGNNFAVTDTNIYAEHEGRIDLYTRSGTLLTKTFIGNLLTNNDDIEPIEPAIAIVSVPEPSTGALAALAMAAMVWIARRRRT